MYKTQESDNPPKKVAKQDYLYSFWKVLDEHLKTQPNVFSFLREEQPLRKIFLRVAASTLKGHHKSKLSGQGRDNNISFIGW